MNNGQEEQLLQNLSKVQNLIESLSLSNKIKPKLLVVSKKQSVAAMRMIYNAGMNEFAESFMQEATKKIPQLPTDISWHYIGRLQSNKIKKIAQYFHWVHTLSSIYYAEKLQVNCAEFNKNIQVLIQVNVDLEVQKVGIMLTDRNKIELLVSYIIKHCPNLQLKGLMCILKVTGKYDKELASFQKLAECKDKINQQFMLNLQQLSMGMSNDMPSAINAGSTMLRVGTTIFGDR